MEDSPALAALYNIALALHVVFTSSEDGKYEACHPNFCRTYDSLEAAICDSAEHAFNLLCCEKQNSDRLILAIRMAVKEN